MTVICACLKPLNTKILVAWFIWNAKCYKNAIGVVAAILKLFCVLSKLCWFGEVPTWLNLIQRWAQHKGVNYTVATTIYIDHFTWVWLQGWQLLFMLLL